MRMFGIVGMALAAGLMSACTHVAGVVVNGRGMPVPTAVFSIGRPTDIAHYGTHRVDDRGHFDFYISPTDETNLYVYDSLGDPSVSIRQINREEISDHMKVRLDSSNLEMDPTLRAVPFGE